MDFILNFDDELEMYAISRYIKLEFMKSEGQIKFRYNKIYVLYLRNIGVKLIYTKREKGDLNDALEITAV